MRIAVVISGGALSEVTADAEASMLQVSLLDFDNLEAEGIGESDLTHGVCPEDVDADSFAEYLEVYRFWQNEGHVVY